MNKSTGRTSTRLPLRLGRQAPDDAHPLPALPQFAHVQRYWDQAHTCFVARVLPGEFYVTTHSEAVSTVLGSCVSACIRDTRINVGGMNHFMLPLDASKGASAWGEAASSATRYGNVAMERLVNEILKLGGRRENLEIKLVGGGHVLAEMQTDIGARNIDFVRQFIQNEGYSIAGEDLGDCFPRRVIYFPQSGRMRVRKLDSRRDETLAAQERAYLKQLDTTPIEGEVELF
jgi:chemotaxis protein CheD